MSKMTEVLSGENFFLDEETVDYTKGEEKDVTDFALVSIFGETYLKKLVIIAECYHHKNYGSGKRKWLKQFSEQERKVVSNWYLRIYAWHLRTGFPRKGVRMSISTYQTLLKAAHFFAAI